MGSSTEHPVPAANLAISKQRGEARVSYGDNYKKHLDIMQLDSNLANPQHELSAFKLFEKGQLDIIGKNFLFLNKKEVQFEIEMRWKVFGRSKKKKSKVLNASNVRFREDDYQFIEYNKANKEIEEKAMKLKSMILAERKTMIVNRVP
ncbi:MAG: hypothetical protein EZS28_033699 [Streblomastix strix]|uniref:Uncharacterized protein n=1 Tax=Streblomastix strix TaxID=222440 RepID=A0A5J4UKL8_9EUKA|nr:MAG: hypothetical protein EZS28_033699 [Streblomastix strix]